jgi:hypothetical protein
VRSAIVSLHFDPVPDLPRLPRRCQTQVSGHRVWGRRSRSHATRPQGAPYTRWPRAKQSKARLTTTCRTTMHAGMVRLIIGPLCLGRRALAGPSETEAGRWRRPAARAARRLDPKDGTIRQSALAWAAGAGLILDGNVRHGPGEGPGQRPIRRSGHTAPEAAAVVRRTGWADLVGGP